MQIPCISCQSRFRLDSSLVKATGSLVRCSKCKYIFRVFPQAFDDEPIIKDTRMDQSTPDDIFEVEPVKIENGPFVKASEELNRYRIDEIASIDAFAEEEEVPEIEDIDLAELTQLPENAEMTDWDEHPNAEDLSKQKNLRMRGVQMEKLKNSGQAVIKVGPSGNRYAKIMRTERRLGLRDRRRLNTYIANDRRSGLSRRKPIAHRDRRLRTEDRCQSHTYIAKDWRSGIADRRKLRR